MSESKSTFRPLIIGEVLFDHFPDGKSVLGGAPFNVAWNLRGLGLDPAFISAVGTDEEGREILKQMERIGLSTSLLQTSELLPTGQVRVELNGSQPTFHILDRQAYDDIRYPNVHESLSDFSMLYVGSLAFRNDPSRSTIRRLMKESGLPRFVDVNIRQPWFNREWLPDLLTDAEWVKLNNDELSWVTEMECLTSDQIRAATEKLRIRFGGKQCFITCGSAGAYAVNEQGDVLFSEAPTPKPLVNTVGAGDAFSAATIYGVSRQQPLESILRFAARFASRACTIQGATTGDLTYYENFKRENESF